jgi:hypothetical protein
MSVVLTGPHKGEMKYTLPQEADVQMVQEIVLAIQQLDFPVTDVKYSSSTNRIEVVHAFTVKGTALTHAMTQLDREICNIVDAVRNRQIAPAILVFSNR